MFAGDGLLSFGLYISLSPAISALTLPSRNPTAIAAVRNDVRCFEPQPFRPSVSWDTCNQILKDIIDSPDWDEEKKYGPGLRRDPIVWLGKQCSIQLMSIGDSDEDIFSLDDVHDVAIDILAECEQYRYGGRGLVGSGKRFLVIVHGLAMSLSMLPRNLTTPNNSTKSLSRLAVTTPSKLLSANRGMLTSRTVKGRENCFPEPGIYAPHVLRPLLRRCAVCLTN